MSFNPRRNSLRYPGYDYSQSGACFVTICTHNRQHLFGTVENGQMLQSIPGAFVCQAWNRLPERFPDIMLDVFIVMPDHLHGIILTGSDPSLEQQANTVGFTINSFKNTVSSAWRDGVASNGWPRYQEQLWQRNYHDRIIRNEHELQALRDYVAANPAQWEAKQAAR